MNLVVEL